MALAKIKRVELVAPKETQEEMLSTLQQLGLVEIEKLKEDGQYEGGIIPQTIGSEADSWQDFLGNIKYCLDFLGAYREKSGSFLDQLASNKQAIEAADFQLTAEMKEEIEALYQECKDFEKQLPALKRRAEIIEERTELFTPWLYLDLPLEELGTSKYLHTLAAQISAKRWKRLNENLAALQEPYFLEVGEISAKLHFVLVTRAEEGELAQKIVVESGAVISSFGQGQGTAKEQKEKLERELASVEEELAEITQNCTRLATEKLAQLELAYDYASSQLELAKVQGELLATDATFALQGWILETDVQKLQEALAKFKIPIYLNIREAQEEEEPPVYLKNSGLAWPFEAVLEMYSPPKSGEVDPTPWVAVFFSLFFGIMLTDAGYGIIMALAAMWLLKKVKMEDAGRKLLLVLFWGGVASGLAGALAGGWFGDLFGIPPLWFNPSDEPLKMMVLSFGLGLFHIFTGMGIEFYDNVRAGKVWDAIFDQGLWFVLILGLVFLFLPPLSGIGGTLAKIGAIGLVLTQGRNQKNIFMKLGAGLVSLYNLSGVLGDVLSYSRLLALGLATGIIANVINMVASMALDFPYGLGYPIMAVVLVGGHIFNIFINVMGSYVHTSRLQYIEFFGQFYEGGGKLFSPFKIKQNYTYFKEDEEEA